MSPFFFFPSHPRYEQNHHLRVSVGSPPASKGLHDVDEAPVVLDPPLGAAGLLLLLFLCVDLGGLTLDLAGTGQRAVHLEKDKEIKKLIFCQTSAIQS
jgi:hypothetical protein